MVLEISAFGARALDPILKESTKTDPLLFVKAGFLSPHPPLFVSLFGRKVLRAQLRNGDVSLRSSDRERGEGLFLRSLLKDEKGVNVELGAD